MSGFFETKTTIGTHETIELINLKDSSLENWLKTSSIKSILGCLISALNRWIEFLVVLLVGLIWEIEVDNPSESSLNIPSRW